MIMSHTTAVSASFEEMSREVVSYVFSTMLETDVIAGELPDKSAHFPIVGTIYFAGGWKGAVFMEFEENLALDMAAHLLKADRPARIDRDVRDAVGEVVNMVAGNLKPILPDESHMSMPSVVQGDDFKVSILGSNKYDRMAFRCPGGTFSLTLVQLQD